MWTNRRCYRDEMPRYARNDKPPHLPLILSLSKDHPEPDEPSSLRNLLTHERNE